VPLLPLWAFEGCSGVNFTFNKRSVGRGSLCSRNADAYVVPVLYIGYVCVYERQ